MSRLRRQNLRTGDGMTELDKLISRLRELVNERHQAALQAIDALVENLAGPTLPAVQPKPESSHQRNGTLPQVAAASDGNKGEDGQSNVEKVLATIEGTYKPVERIATETGLTDRQVRGVLYSEFVAPQVEKIRKDKRTQYMRKAH
jgi:hypothetical protein